MDRLGLKRWLSGQIPARLVFEYAAVPDVV
jgi:hypothetical protein